MGIESAIDRAGHALRQVIETLRAPSTGSGDIDGGRGAAVPDRIESGYTTADGAQFGLAAEVLGRGEDGLEFRRERFYPLDADGTPVDGDSTPAAFDIVVVETGDAGDTVIVFDGQVDGLGNRSAGVAVNGVLYRVTLAPGQTLEIRSGGGDDAVLVDATTIDVLTESGGASPIVAVTGAGRDVVLSGIPADDPEGVLRPTADTPPFNVIHVDAEPPPATAAPVAEVESQPPSATPPLPAPPTTVATGSTPPPSVDPMVPVAATPPPMPTTLPPGHIESADALRALPEFTALSMPEQALLQAGLDAGGSGDPGWLARANTLISGAGFADLPADDRAAALGTLSIEAVAAGRGPAHLVGPFPSADAAAIAALTFGNPATGVDGLERGGIVLLDPSTGMYHVTTPVLGTETALSHEVLPQRRDFAPLVTVGFYHTHPAVDMVDTPHGPISIDRIADHFSPDDQIVLASSRYGDTAWLGSQDGTYLRLHASELPGAYTGTLLGSATAV